MESLITQVPQTGPRTDTLQQHSGQSESHPGGDEYEEDYGNSLIHLNIRGTHYYITRDQLMLLPESLLLCLFPNGVFLDRNGQVITNLTPEDEVYIPNFFPDCFEYIMHVYNEAYHDYVYYPVNKIFDRATPGRSGLFSFGSNNSHESTEQEILHEKPTIIVLREDLDYYCVPQCEFLFDNDETKEDLLYHIMAQVKSAAGSYLTSKGSIFEGLYSSNRLRKKNHRSNNNNNNNTNNSYDKNDYSLREGELGPAEQHLKDMLCSSGFQDDCVWGNRFQEPGKTVISSLSLCRIANETTENFRRQYAEMKARWEEDQRQQQQKLQQPQPLRDQTLSPTHSLTPTESNQTSGRDRPSSRMGRDKRKSRLSALADNVRSRSSSRPRSQSRQRDTPKLYDLIPKPDINVKLLLFWRKPARKCWWGEQDLDLEVEIYGSWDTEPVAPPAKPRLKVRTPKTPTDGLNKTRIPLRLHIRRVWTLELSVIGAQ